MSGVARKEHPRCRTIIERLCREQDWTPEELLRNTRWDAVRRPFWLSDGLERQLRKMVAEERESQNRV